MTLIRFFTILFILTSSYQLTAQVPANDELANAIELTVQAGNCKTQTSGTTQNTVASSDNIASCFDSNIYDYAITEVYDVWYKAIVPDSGKLTMMVAATSDDTQVHGVWSDDDGDGVLTQVHCTDSWKTYEKYVLEDGTSGSVLYFQVLAANAYDTANTLNFNICVYDPDSTLDTPIISKPMLSYYSNPMGNRLRLESPYKIQSLAIHDLAGREVLTKSPQKQNLWLNTYSLSSGVYLLKVQTAEGQQTVQLVKK